MASTFSVRKQSQLCAKWTCLPGVCVGHFRPQQLATTYFLLLLLTAVRNQPGRNVLHGPQCSRIFAGLLDVEHRLAIATRHGKVVLMKNGAVTSTIHLDVSTVCTVAPAFLVMHRTASSCGVCYCPASCHMAAVQLLFSGFVFAVASEV